MNEISIPVSAEIATAYQKASPEAQKKIAAFVGLQLTEFLRSPESLEQVMDGMSDEANQNGLTSARLDDILSG